MSILAVSFRNEHHLTFTLHFGTLARLAIRHQLLARYDLTTSFPYVEFCMTGKLVKRLMLTYWQEQAILDLLKRKSGN